MKNRMCEMFGIDVPIFAFSHCRDVVVEVSKAGGMGVLGMARMSPDQVEADLKWIDDHIEGKPYGIDVLMPQKIDDVSEMKYDPDELLPKEHVQFVRDMLEKAGIPELPTDEAAELKREIVKGMNFTPRESLEMIDACMKHPIKLIVNALGPPPPDMIERAHANGVLVGALAGKKAHAVRHVASGVDIIIAQGHEAGGHTGDIGTMVLVPEIVDAVAPTPVLAAGGIGSGRQVAASIALGAQGVWCGSVWLTTLEAETHPVVKEKFLAATSSDTLRSRSRTGKPARQLRSAWTDEWEGESSPGTLPMPLQPMLIAHASRQVDRAAMNPENKGAVELSNYFVGQIVGSMNESISATRVVEDMITEYLDVIERFDELNN